MDTKFDLDEIVKLINGVNHNVLSSSPLYPYA